MAFKASQSRPPACFHSHCPLDAAPTLEHPIRLKLTTKPQPVRMSPLTLSQPLPWPQDPESSKTSFQKKEVAAACGAPASSTWDTPRS